MKAEIAKKLAKLHNDLACLPLVDTLKSNPDKLRRVDDGVDEAIETLSILLNDEGYGALITER
jgi:hypothetical protein